MKRFVEGTDRGQSTLFPAVLDDYVGEDNPVRAIDVFVDGLDLAKLGFDGVAPLATGRPAYHPAPLLKIYASPTSRTGTGRSTCLPCRDRLHGGWCADEHHRHRRPSALRLETANSDREDCQQHTIRVVGPLCCAAGGARFAIAIPPAPPR
jgi:hypothetical protein